MASNFCLNKINWQKTVLLCLFFCYSYLYNCELIDIIRFVHLSLRQIVASPTWCWNEAAKVAICDLLLLNVPQNPNWNVFSPRTRFSTGFASFWSQVNKFLCAQLIEINYLNGCYAANRTWFTASVHLRPSLHIGSIRGLRWLASTSMSTSLNLWHLHLLKVNLALWAYVLVFIWSTRTFHLSVKRLTCWTRFSSLFGESWGFYDRHIRARLTKRLWRGKRKSKTSTWVYSPLRSSRTILFTNLVNLP